MKRLFQRDGDGLNEYERGLLSNIEKHGWQCTSVFDPDGENPGFSYSIGFTKTLNAPEFIIFGLDHECDLSMLWEIFRQIRDGKEVVDGARWTNLIEGFDCVGRAVDPSNVITEYLNSAIWFWRRSGREDIPPVFQIVWPGKLDGLFPWDEGCSDIVQELQPPLWLPAGSHA